MQLKNKYESPQAPKTSNWADSLQKERHRAEELNREYESIGAAKERPLKEIEERVRLWRDQKQILGVKDSDVEQRAQTLFAMIDVDNHRRRKYIGDMEMFKKRLDDTKAVSTSNVVRIREIEDVIVQRDSSFV